MRQDILDKKEWILEQIAKNQSKAFICRELQCKPETLNSYLQKMGIEYKGNQSHKGQQINATYKSVLEYIQKDNIKSHTLKLKLIRENIKEEKCEICGLSEWQGIKIPLELHHKDCNHYNNDLDNLQILCPNCHSIQPGNSGRNIKKNINYCIDCGIEISKTAIRCKKCEGKQRLQEIPISREELKCLIRTKPFTTIGKNFNVSDNTIRKWCIKNNLPSKSTEIKKYSNEEWELI